MILDTNILLRLIDGPTGPRHREIREHLEKALAAKEKLIVDIATIHEVIYVLRSKATGYGYSRTDATQAIHDLVLAPELTVDQAEVLRRAATAYGAHEGIDFHDCYLAETARARNEAIYSLDGDFKKLA